MSKKDNKKVTFCLIVLIIILTVVPLFIAKDAEFTGADGKAEDAITEISPDYRPWFTPIWEPPSSEIESLLFVLQAAIGAGIIGFGLGIMYCHKREQKRKNGEKA